MSVRFYDYPPGRGWDDVFAVWLDIESYHFEYYDVSSLHHWSIWQENRWLTYQPKDEQRPTQYILKANIRIGFTPKQKPFLRKPTRRDIR